MGYAGNRHRCRYECAVRCRSRRGGARAVGRPLSLIWNIKMSHLCKLTIPALTLILSAFALPTGVRADDIDIFLGTSGGSADAPNIIFLIDNSPNWSRASQHWPDNGGNQGQAELAAIISTLRTINGTRPANVGIAMLTAYGGSATASAGATPGTGGGYIRFGVRDMTNATNNAA